MRLLAFDLGLRRTGVAFFDDASGIELPLGDLHHQGKTELLAKITTLCNERACDTIILGLPLLPQGSAGAQASRARNIASFLEEHGFTVHLIDERYTSKGPRSGKNAYAALEILKLWLRRSKNRTK